MAGVYSVRVLAMAQFQFSLEPDIACGALCTMVVTSTQDTVWQLPVGRHVSWARCTVLVGYHGTIVHTVRLRPTGTVLLMATRQLYACNCCLYDKKDKGFFLPSEGGI